MNPLDAVGAAAPPFWSSLRSARREVVVRRRRWAATSMHGRGDDSAAAVGGDQSDCKRQTNTRDRRHTRFRPEKARAARRSPHVELELPARDCPRAAPRGQSSAAATVHEQQRRVSPRPGPQSGPQSGRPGAKSGRSGPMQADICPVSFNRRHVTSGKLPGAHLRRATPAADPARPPTGDRAERRVLIGVELSCIAALRLPPGRTGRSSSAEARRSGLGYVRPRAERSEMP